MTTSTKRLLETWLRLLKGCLRATEMWLREQPVDVDVKSDSHSSTESGG